MDLRTVLTMPAPWSGVGGGHCGAQLKAASGGVLRTNRTQKAQKREEVGGRTRPRHPREEAVCTRSRGRAQKVSVSGELWPQRRE